MAVYGQDWSAYQPGKPSTSGLDFAFVKATEGHTYTSPLQTEQAAHARAAGLAVGFYHFLWPGDIEAQAEHFVAKCASVEGDLLACDWETTSEGTAASGAEKDAFLAAVRRLRPKHKVLLYCNRSFWLDRDTTSDCGDGLWIADPSSRAGHPAVKHAWTIHQYSEAGGLDRDLAHFSSKSALDAWARARLSNATKAPIPKPSSGSPEPGESSSSDGSSHEGEHSVLGSVKREVGELVHAVETEVSDLFQRGKDRAEADGGGKSNGGQSNGDRSNGDGSNGDGSNGSKG